MSSQKLIQTVLLLIIFSGAMYPVFGYGATVGPYSGQILDGESGQPIEGATVLMYWTKLIPDPNRGSLDPRLLLLAQKDGLDPSTLMLKRSEDIDARLIYTNNQGRYDIPRVSINTGLTGKIEEFHLVIYQPGYQIHTVTKRLLRTAEPSGLEEYHDLNYRVSLKRTPPRFDHDKHLDMLRDALHDMTSSTYLYDQNNPLSWDKFLEKRSKRNPEIGIVLRRAEWESKSIENSGTQSLANDINTRYSEQWIKLLKTGSIREKQIALENLSFLQLAENRKDPHVFDPIIKTLKDADPLAREAAAAFFKDLGHYTHGCCLDTNILAALEEALTDRNANVRAEAAKALGFYKDKRAVSALISSLRDSDRWVRLYAVRSLGSLGWYVPTRIGIRNKEQERQFSSQGETWMGKSIMSNGAYYSSEIIDENGKQVRIITAVENPSPRLYFGLPKFSIRPPDNKNDLGAGAAIHPIIEILLDKSNWPHDFLRRECARAIGKMYVQDDRSVKALLQVYSESSLKLDVIDALGNLEALAAESALVQSLSDTDEEVRQHALAALLRLPIDWSTRTSSNFIERYSAQLKKQQCEERVFSAFALSSIGGKQTMLPLLQALKDPCDLVVRRSLDGLATYYDPVVLPELVDLFGHTNKQIREAAVSSFNGIAMTALRRSAKVFRAGGLKFVVRTPIGKHQYRQVDKRHPYNAVVPEKILNDNFIIRGYYENPELVTKLIAVLPTKDPTMNISILSIITQFEDNRIEPALIKLIDDPSIAVSAIVALRNYGTSASIPRLVKILRDHEKSLSPPVFETIGAIGDQTAAQAIRLYLNGKDSRLRAAAMKCLELLGNTDMYETALAALAERKDVSEINAAIELLGKTKDTRAIEPLIAIVKEGNVQIAGKAARLLGTIGDRRAVEPLMDKLVYLDSLGPNYSDNFMKNDIIEALTKIGDTRAVPVLMQMLKSNSPGVVDKSIYALQELKDSRAVPALISVSNRRMNTWNFIQSSTRALGKIGSPAALDHLEKLLYEHNKTDKTGYIRGNIIQAIGDIKSEKTVALLTRYLDSSEFLLCDIPLIMDIFIKNNHKSPTTVRSLIRVSGKTQREFCDAFVNKFNNFSENTENPKDVANIVLATLKEDNKDSKVGGIRIGGYFYRFKKIKDEFIMKSLMESLGNLKLDNDSRVQSEAALEIKLIEVSLYPRIKQLQRGSGSRTTRETMRPSVN